MIIRTLITLPFHQIWWWNFIVTIFNNMSLKNFQNCTSFHFIAISYSCNTCYIRFFNIFIYLPLFPLLNCHQTYLKKSKFFAYLAGVKIPLEKKFPLNIISVIIFVCKNLKYNFDENYPLMYSYYHCMYCTYSIMLL